MTLLSKLASGARAYVLLALITFCAAAPGVFAVPALDRDESRFAQASKQMLETGDFIRIRYQDEGRNKKPAGIHWLQAGATAVFSSPEAGAIWSYRLPSLLGAVLATLATFWCGIVLIGRRGAFLGAALFGAGILLTTEAHIAKTDAVLVFLTTLTMGALARIYAHAVAASALPESAGKRLGRLSLLFWGAMGAAFLIKGPVTMLVAAMAILLISATRRSVRWTRPLWNWRGAVLFVILVLPWFLWVQIATSGAFLDGAVGKDLKDKFVGASEGHGGLPGYHLAFLVTHFFPATLMLVPSLVLAVHTLRGRALDVVAAERSGLVFLAAWAVPTWLFFELLPTKLSHYILPAYPALALICGWGAVQLMGEARVPVSRYISLALFGLGGAVLCVLASPLGVNILQNEAAGDFRFAATSSEVLSQWVGAGAMPLWLLLAGLLAVVLTTVTGVLRRYGASLTLAIGASVLIGWHVRWVFLPGQVWMQPTVTARAALGEVCGVEPEAAEKAGCIVPERVQAVGYAEPSLVFTTGTNTVIPPQTVAALPDDEAGYPLVYLLNLEDAAGRDALTELEALAEEAGRNTQVSTMRYGLNYSNGDPVAFVALRID